MTFRNWNPPPQRQNKQEHLKVRTCLYCVDGSARTRLAWWINFRDVCFICQLQTHLKRAFNKDLEGDLDMAPNLKSFSQNDLENFLTLKLFRITQSPVLTECSPTVSCPKTCRHDANNDTHSEFNIYDALSSVFTRNLLIYSRFRSNLARIWTD